MTRPQSAKSLLFITAFLIILCDFCLSAYAADEVGKTASRILDQIIAVLDDEPLTGMDLKGFAASQGRTLPDNIHGGSKDVRQLLRDMILVRLLSKEASEHNIKVGSDEVDFYVKQIKQQNSVSDEEFLLMLSGQGLDLKAYKSVVTNDILRARVLATVVRAKIEVVDEDVVRYLREHPDSKPDDNMVHLEQMFVRSGRLSEEAVSELKAHLAEVKNTVAAGTSFREAAKQFYQDLGYVDEEDLREELSAALKSLKAGELSEVVQTDTGFYLLRLVSRYRGEATLDEEFKKAVSDQLFEEKMKEAAAKYLNDELPKKYNVEIKL